MYARYASMNLNPPICSTETWKGIVIDSERSVFLNFLLSLFTEQKGNVPHLEGLSCPHVDNIHHHLGPYGSCYYSFFYSCRNTNTDQEIGVFPT